MIKNGRAALLLALGPLLACQALRRPPTDGAGAYQGTVEYQEQVLAFEVPGRLKAVEVRRGDGVQAGAVVAVLDDALAQMGVEGRQSEAQAAEAQTALLRAGSRPEEIRAAEAQVAAARAVEDQLVTNLARDEALSRAGAKPPALVDDLRAQARRATEERLALEHRLAALRQGARRPEIKSASDRAQAVATAAALEKARLGRYRLTATMAGTVLDVHVEPGEVVAPGTPVVTVADTRHPYAEVFVPERELPRVRVGDAASLRVDGLALPVAGRVEHIARQAEFTPKFLFSERERPNLVFRVRVAIDDPQGRLRAGLPAFVTLAAAPAAGGGR
jgi:HlyD family secretion protein